ncbi:putative RNA helicase [Helianthus anomalus]
MIWSFIKAHLNSRILVFLSACKQVIFFNFVFQFLILFFFLFCNLEHVTPVLMQQFVEQRSVLFSTDVSSRGLDFNKGVDWVVQVIYGFNRSDKT